MDIETVFHTNGALQHMGAIHKRHMLGAVLFLTLCGVFNYNGVSMMFHFNDASVVFNCSP